MDFQILHRLQATLFAEGLSEDQLNVVAPKCQREYLKAGERLCGVGDVLTKLYIVEKGCLVAKTGSADQSASSFVNSGESLGQYCILLDEPVLVDVFAEFDTALFSIDREAVLELVARFPRIRENLTRTFRQRLRNFVQGETVRRYARSIAFVRKTAVMSDVLVRVASQLRDRGEKVVLVSDRQVASRDVEWRPLELGSVFQRQLLAARNAHDRTIVDLEPRSSGEFFAALEACDEIFWVFDSASDPTLRLLNEFLERTGVLSTATKRVKRIYLLPPGELVAPQGLEDRRLRKRDFLLASPETGMGKRLYNQGIARLVRHLCDVKIGLALGGGGARGLAHFGVLRALDRAGISFDIMSGTSAGSMFGLSYAAGLEVDFMIQTYSLDLRPPRLFRRLPGGDRLYLIWKFRTRGWDKMLRPYFHDWTMEQLQIPFVSVAVDLVSGNPVVTETGDIISAMLESLNLPGVAQPILKDGRALVDGGVLNNLPGDVLVERNADYVVGVNVGAELSQKFGVNRPGMKTEEMKMPGNLETLFRVLEVVGKGTAELKRSSIDLQIQPDMSRASFSDFTQGAALAEIGEAAAEASLPELQASLLELTRFKPA